MTSPSAQVEVYLDTDKYHEVIIARSHGETTVVHYLPFGQYATSYPPDVFVAWRYFISLALVHSQPPPQTHQYRQTKRILWLHDLLEEVHLPSEVSSLVCTSCPKYLLILHSAI
jgi:hypothetical protein